MMSTIKDNKHTWIAFWMRFSLLTPAKAAPDETDMQDIVFSHIRDAYAWHITERDGQEVVILLPTLVKSEERGWDLFLSSHLYYDRAHHNYYVARGDEHAGKVVEKNSIGEGVRLMDSSLAESVCELFLSCGLLLLVALRTVHWYKKHLNKASDEFIGLVEMAISYMQDGVIKEAIGKEYKPFSSYLSTVFFFILINNLIGIVLVFPGGVNTTGNIVVTGVLAFRTSMAVDLLATRVHQKEVSQLKAPIHLKLSLSVMPFMKFFGVFTKPFALMIRLFANIMVGHMTILALTCLISITVTMGVAVNFGMTIVPVLFCVFMNCLELLMAYLQVCAFTLPSVNRIGLAKVRG